jgi:triacylglycerol esterase/lipase EstA (alpha/beta hydrolase family)
MSWLLQPIALLSLVTLFYTGVGACFKALDRGQKVRLTRANVSTFCREWAVCTFVVLTWPFGILNTTPRRVPAVSEGEEGGQGDEPIPVVLVPGYGVNRAYFSFLQMYLRRRGWPWVAVINHRPFSASVPYYAERLGLYVDDVLRASGAQQVDLVGHSMGGLVAAFYVNALGGHTRVRRLVTLGAPWKGTATWVFGGRRQARDMAPDSDVVKAVQDLKTPTTAIWSRSDAMIFPAERAKPDGGDAIELANLGHNEMLFSARVFRLVAQLLSSGRAVIPVALESVPAAEPVPTAVPEKTEEPV